MTKIANNETPTSSNIAHSGCPLIDESFGGWECANDECSLDTDTVENCFGPEIVGDIEMIFSVDLTSEE